MKFRIQRGGYKESMKLVKKFEDEKALMLYLETQYESTSLIVEELRFQHLGFDKRNKWDTYLVALRFQGMTNFLACGYSHGNFTDNNKEFAKYCPHCKKDIPHEEFKDIKAPYCPPCATERRRAYAKKNRKKINKRQREFYRARPELAKANHKRFKEENPDYWKEHHQKNYISKKDNNNNN